MTEGMPAKRLMTAPNTRLTRGPQKRARNTAVKKPRMPPMISAPTVEKMEPTIIVRMP